VNRRKFLLLSLSTFLIGPIVDRFQRKISRGRLGSEVAPLEYGSSENRGIGHLQSGAKTIAVVPDLPLDEGSLFAEDPISEHSVPTAIYISGS